MLNERVDRANRTVRAEVARVYRAFLDATDLEKWLPPSGMIGQVHEIDATVGGGYVMTLRHQSSEPTVRGKTTDLEDRFSVRFDALEPERTVVQHVIFDADDPAFSGTMRQTWTLEQLGDATKVSVACENVPTGIRPEDHEVGLNSSLENLARLTENRF